MPWFPPAPQSNNTCYLSDFYYVELGNVARFADYNVPCTMYWPWLAWGGIDDDWVAGEAMVRCQLLPPVALPIPAVHAEGVGAILSFGRADGPEYWEVVETLQWWSGDPATLKLVLLWARPHYVIAGPTPIPPYYICDGSPVLEPDTTYIVDEPGDFGVTNWFQFESTPSALHHIIFEIISGDPDATILVSSNDCVTLLLVTGPHGPGCYEFTGPFVGLPTCFVTITFAAAVEYTVRWGLGPCP